MTRQLYVFASENYDKNFVYDLKETQWLYFSNIYSCILGNVHEYMGKEYNIHHWACLHSQQLRRKNIRQICHPLFHLQGCPDS
jgi:hypothetical protein